ncbi:hypothetical protein D3C83_207790 [compost metagenome]
MPLVVPLVDVSAWLITAPLPALAPVTLTPTTVQVKVVPATLLGVERIATLLDCPEQIV